MPTGTGPRSPSSSPLSSNRGFPPRLDTTATTTSSFATGAAPSEPISTPPSSSSRRASLSQFRPQSLHLPSRIHQAHARAAPAGHARQPRRWTSSSPQVDADLLRPRVTSAAAAVSQPSALQRVASGIRRLTRTSLTQTPGGEGGDEEDWSVFGEAMSHEGAQPPPPPSPLSSSFSAQRSEVGVDGAVPAVHVLVPTPVGDTYDIRRTQSPVSDHYLPLGVEDEERAEGNHYDGASSLERGLHPPSDTELPSSISSSRDTDPKDQDRKLGRSRERWWRRLSHLPTLPTLYRNILKCSLAYLLGSLFTYYPPLSRFISELTQDSPGEKYPSAMGHMVATV